MTSIIIFSQTWRKWHKYDPTGTELIFGYLSSGGWAIVSNIFDKVTHGYCRYIYCIIFYYSI